VEMLNEKQSSSQADVVYTAHEATIQLLAIFSALIIAAKSKMPN